MGARRLQDAQALVLEVRLGLDDVDLGHASGRYEAAVDVAEFLGPFDSSLGKPRVFLRAQQVPVGVDHLPDGLRNGGFEPQLVDALAEPCGANGGEGDVDAAAAQERLALFEHRDRALAALQELEADHRARRIDDEDYRRQVGPLRREAAQALRALDDAEEQPTRP